MKKTGKIILLLLCFMFLIAGQVWAAEREYDVVRANGSVTREVTPDTAFVNVGVTTQGTTPALRKKTSKQWAIICTQNIAMLLKVNVLLQATV